MLKLVSGEPRCEFRKSGSGCILTVTCDTHSLSLCNQESGETSTALIEASCPELHGCRVPSFLAFLPGSQLPAKGGWRAGSGLGNCDLKCLTASGWGSLWGSFTDSQDLGPRPLLCSRACTSEHCQYFSLPSPISPVD